MAVASVTQRGVQDVNVVSVVSIWFLALGLLANVSNMLRLAHVFVQWKQPQGEEPHVEMAVHHCILLGLLLGVMLFMFLVLAVIGGGPPIFAPLPDAGRRVRAAQ